MTTALDVNAALRAKHSGPEWRIWFEVNQGTGSRMGRRADAVAMNIWPSKGYQMHCYEVKVSRADFMQEMKDITKAEAVGRYCDFFWLATPAGLVRVDEVPAAWGLIELTKGGLRVKKQAPLREADVLERAFAASILRAGEDRTEAAIAQEVASRVEKHRVAAEEAAERKYAERLARETERNDKLERWCAEFQENVGAHVNPHSSPKDMAKRMAFALSLERRNYANLARQARALADLIDGLDESAFG